jgi:dienelactone hydrolase
MPRIGKRGKAIVITCFIGVVLFACSSNIPPFYKATLFILELFSPSQNSRLHLLTRPPIQEEISIPYLFDRVEAYYFHPSEGGPYGAFIFALGYPSNIKDPQVVRLADSLARLGYVVLVPQLPGLRAGELTVKDVEILVSAFEWLSLQPEVDPERIGFGGFCVGSSLALLAAEDPRINQRVALVNVFGGYYDLMSLLRATAAHSAHYRGQEYPWDPAQPTLTLFAQNLLGLLEKPADRIALSGRLQEEAVSGTTSNSSDSFPDLVHSLLTTTEPEQVEALLAELPPDALDHIARLSPGSGILNLKAKVFIMHDIHDPYVPVTESYRLAEAIVDPEQKVYAQFVLFDHMIPYQNVSQLALIKDVLRLIVYLGRMFYALTPGN